MEFRRLYYFHTLAENKNFTKTAEILHITQPTLSQQIAELESVFGAKLFIRSNRKVTLSPVGEMLFLETSKLFAQYNRCMNVAALYKNGYDGQINIVSLDVVEPTFLPQFLSYFTEKYPKINVTLRNAYFSQMLSMVENLTVDFALTLIPTYKTYTNIKKFSMNTDRLVIGVPKNSEFDNIKALPDPNIKQLLSRPGFMFSGWYECTETIDYLKQFHDPLILTYFDSASAMIMKLMEKKGFTLAPEKWLNFMDPQQKFHYIYLPDPHSSLDFSLIYNADNTNPCVPLFMNEASGFI